MLAVRKLALKKSYHINKSKKHHLGKQKLSETTKQEQNIADALDVYNKKEHLVGENLPPE